MKRLLLPLLAMAILPPLPLSAVDAPPAGTPKQGSAVFKWEDLPVRQTAAGEQRAVANKPTSTLAVFECHISTLNPGEASHPPHRHATEELIIVKEGKLEVYIDGHTEEAGPGSTFFYSSMDPHRVRNLSKDRATYFVVNLATAATYGTSMASETVLPSAAFNWDKLEVVTTKTGFRRAIMDGRTRTLNNLETHATTVRPGEINHEAHRHPDDEVILLREGNVEISINGKVFPATPGSVIFFSSGDLHNLRNTGTTPATFHVIRMVTAATPAALETK